MFTQLFNSILILSNKSYHSINDISLYLKQVRGCDIDSYRYMEHSTLDKKIQEPVI